MSNEVLRPTHVIAFITMNANGEPVAITTDRKLALDRLSAFRYGESMRRLNVPISDITPDMTNEEN